ncbi:MAG: DUF5722 domain-containing protein [Gaiellaceae bacterium]
MRRAILIAAAAVVAAASALATDAKASKYLKTGIFDDAQVLYGTPEETFPLLKTTRSKLVRVNVWWSGPGISVAKRRPKRPADPADSAYDWTTYDRTVRYAVVNGMQPVFSIIGTPPWANSARGWNVAPTKAADLKAFATAAATRYSGTYEGPDGNVLPRVASWIAWNEPNNPVFMRPQYVRSGRTWVIQSAKDYARICNAVVAGVRAARGGKVACGVTAPRGNNNPNSGRASVSPLAFLRAMKRAGAKGFDAYAHHPYYGTPTETPSTKPPPGKRGQAPTAVTLANFNLLTAELTRLYGNVRIWITEYGYQTNPPDTFFGVSYKKQAAYLTEAVAIARANPRVDMFLWFLLKDEIRADGWQSGLMTAAGAKKPSFAAFVKANR